MDALDTPTHRAHLLELSILKSDTPATVMGCFRPRAVRVSGHTEDILLKIIGRDTKLLALVWPEIPRLMLVKFWEAPQVWRCTPDTVCPAGAARDAVERAWRGWLAEAALCYILGLPVTELPARVAWLSLLPATSAEQLGHVRCRRVMELFSGLPAGMLQFGWF